MPNSGDTASVSGGRLPVNPRRHRVPAQERKRVATACNACNLRRIRCSGERPCHQCAKSSRDCQYPAAQRQKTPVQREDQKKELQELRHRCTLMEAALKKLLPEHNGLDMFLANLMLEDDELSPPTATTDAGTSVQSDRTNSHTPASQPREDKTPEEATEGRLLQDTDGNARYLGETSGATFLDSVKEFMSTVFPLAFNMAEPTLGASFLGTLGRYQTFDSRPIPMPNVDPLWLPSRTDMVVMFAGLRYFIQDGSGDFPSGGIWYWGDMSAVTREISAESTEANRGRAFNHAAFAIASFLRVTSPISTPHEQPGDEFFARARLLLGSSLDTAIYSKEDVPVLALMALYLLENNRRDAAYMYTCIAMHIAIMHGVHRGWSVDEHGKRVFWTLYVLDRWLSCLMGRPLSIPDDAIQLDMPREHPNLPSPIRLTAHVALSRISDYIVYTVYGVVGSRGRDSAKTASYVDHALQLLTSWLASLPTALQTGPDGFSFSTDRACCALHMAYHQLVILTLRPILFQAVKKAVADRFVNYRWNVEQHPQILKVRLCSDAARRNLRIGRWMRDHISPGRKLLLADLHNIFNAAIILILRQIIFDDLRVEDDAEVEFAIGAFQAESATAPENDYAKDCAGVLEEVFALVKRLRVMMVGDASGGDMPAPPAESPDNEAQRLLIDGLPEADAPCVAGVGSEWTHGEQLYGELMAWMETSELELYGHFLA